MQALATPEGVLDFSSGIVYGSGLVTNTKYLDVCVNMLEFDFVKRGYEVYNATQEVSIFPFLYGIYDMTYNVHPLFVNCYQAPHTATDILAARFDDQYDIKVIITNVVHNVSYVVDTY